MQFTHAQNKTNTHTHTFIHAQARIDTHVRKQAPTDTRNHTVYVLARAHTRMHTQSHLFTYRLTHSRTYTQFTYFKVFRFITKVRNIIPDNGTLQQMALKHNPH